MAIFIKDGKKCFDSQLMTYILKQKNAEAQSLLKTVDNFQNLFDDSGATLLHYAAEYGNAIMTQYLIDIGCKIDYLDGSGRSPLMLAVNKGHVATIDVLLKANVEIDVCNDLRKTVLKSAVQSGAVTQFLNKVKITCFDDDTIMAHKLMQVGCDLIKAVGLGRPGITKVMLESGCSVEERDANRDTALHVAVESMNLDNIKLLVQHGARVNATGCNGRTPLFKYNMHFEDTDAKLDILKFLLDQGASLIEQDLFGTIPLMFLLWSADKEILQVVLRYDVNLHAYDRYYNNPLHYLVENKNPGVLDALRGKSFMVDARNSVGNTPLLLAAKNYDLEKVRFFLEHGADVNAHRGDGYTPLILVFMKRITDGKNMDILELLLQHGADAEATGETIFDLAKQHDFYFRIKSVIASLVMREVLGKQINNLTKDNINANLAFKYHYEKCKFQIKQMRYTIVHGYVSLFKLLFREEKKLVLYARNHEFKSNFQRLMERVNDLDRYILATLNARVNTAVQVAELKEKSASAICRITELPIGTIYPIVYKIINYLSHQDLINLQRV